MNENLRFVLALAAFLALVAGLGLAAGYAVYHALEVDEKETVVKIVAPKAEQMCIRDSTYAEKSTGLITLCRPVMCNRQARS